jgi:hypothetical protein
LGSASEPSTRVPSPGSIVTSDTLASAGGLISIRSMSDSSAEPAANIQVEMRTSFARTEPVLPTVSSKLDDRVVGGRAGPQRPHQELDPRPARFGLGSRRERLDIVRSRLADRDLVERRGCVELGPFKRSRRPERRPRPVRPRQRA